MKRFLPFVLIALLMLSSCGGKEAAPVDIDALEKELVASSIVIDTLVPVKEQVLSSVMHLTADNIDRFSMYMGSGATAEEYGVFVMKSKEAAEKLVAELKDRIAVQKETYESYAPDAILRLDNAVIKQRGAYVCYVVAEQYADALRIVEPYFK